MAEEKENLENLIDQDLSEMMRVRREKMEDFRAMGVAPFGHRFDVADYAADLQKQYAYLEEDEEGGKTRIAGRLMAIRGHGKASFSTLNDRTGNIQIYFKLDILGERKYKEEFNDIMEYDWDTIKSEIAKELNFSLDDNIAENTLIKFFEAATREPQYQSTYHEEDGSLTLSEPLISRPMGEWIRKI